MAKLHLLRGNTVYQAFREDGLVEEFFGVRVNKVSAAAAHQEGI